MTNKKAITMTLAIASILIASPIAMQSASAGMHTMYCSTDKFDPTIGDLSEYVIVIENEGDDCYLGQYGEDTKVYGIQLEGGGKVNVVNTEIGVYSGNSIKDSSNHVKFKDNELHFYVLIQDNNVSQLEVMDNYVSYGHSDYKISVDSNTTNILKIVGNSISVSVDDNTISFFAICKNNTPEAESWILNIYYGKNIGCPKNDDT